MGTIGVKIKIMPISPDIDLEGIKNEARKTIENKEGKNIQFNEEPIAFGLKAIIATFALDEEEGDVEGINDNLSKLKNVNSSQITDMRRAFG